MAESKSAIRFSGWQGVIALIVVLGIAGMRLATLDNGMDDPELMQKLEFQLTTAYFPNDVDKLKSTLESGDLEATAKAVESITTSRVTIKSVHISTPLLKFSSHQDVVVKVDYSLDDASGNRSKGTKYYHFTHRGLMGDSWTYRYETGPISYYLNFL